MELVDPVARVLDEVRARRLAVLEIDRAAPIVLVSIGEVVGGELVEVVPVGTEMVVDNVEDDANPNRVCSIHERTQIIRSAIQPRRRIQVHAVVSPPEPAGKVADRHHLDHRDSQVGKRLDLVGGRGPRALTRKGADVHLVEHLISRRNTGPLVIRPLERRGVDDFRRAVRSVRLKPGHRVGAKAITVESKPVASPCGNAGNRSLERPLICPRKLVAGAAIDYELDSAAPWCPDTYLGTADISELDAS